MTTEIKRFEDGFELGMRVGKKFVVNAIYAKVDELDRENCCTYNCLEWFGHVI